MMWREHRLKGWTMRLEYQLTACGYEGDPELFRRQLPELLGQLFPGATDEELLCSPREKAIPYCEAVRTHFQFNFPDGLILKALINTRKAGRRTN
jgi:hypothetical protein